MPHCRDRAFENRSELVGLKLTPSEVEAIDQLRYQGETRSDFLAAAIDVYKLKRQKSLKYMAKR